ncbi:alpha-amylase family protein [Hyperthermus butylicus]|uniref:Beta-galactosidase trimerisation domain-containing protein n=1 Tax=Hyperthermus butylicus (strain DSM 5456 / JCM 9403 / PLM1-5) TaxID=415426 RepID=A2BJL8_HYPBU|nr:alpha-amylase family protein [Hyperthermus butylicus]ABM80179.1 hypothetical protein Hbut_0307 [Hyperthermus butylicus DSM 5456]
MSRIRGRDVAVLAEKLHANLIVVFARDAWGYTYYRGGRAGPPRPGMPGDFLRELIAEAHRRGIRVVAMVAHTANKLLYLRHRDWAQVNARGEPVLLEHAPSGVWEPEWPQLCPNSPFLEHAVLEVREALELGADGVLFDSFRYQPDPERACYCRWCRKRFRREHGYDMPVEPDWSDNRWRMLWDWRYRVVVGALARLAAEAKAARRDAVVMYNSHPAGWAGRANRVVEMARGILDAVFAECSEADHQPPGFIAEMVKLSRAMAGEGVAIFASRNAFYSLRPPHPAPPPLLRQGLREAFIAGGNPWVLVFSSQLIQRPESLKPIEEVFREHELLEEYLDGAEPVRYAAIIVSNTVRDHYGRLSPERYVDEVRGFYYALQHSHIHVEYLLDQDAVGEALSKYKVVVLADTACVSNELLRALENHVEAGGGVIATFQTSLYNDDCLPAGGLLAESILGARLAGEPVSRDWSYLIPARKHPVLEGIDGPIPLGDIRYDLPRGKELGSIVPVEAARDAEVPAYIGEPAYRYGHEYTLGRSTPPLGYSTSLPGIVVNGKAIYYPWRLGSHYWHTGHPDYQKLIANSIRYAGGNPPLEAEAPETVIVEPWKQGERLVIHLLNYTTGQRIQAISLRGAKQPIPGYSSSEAVHPIREIIPVTGIRIIVDQDLVSHHAGVKAYSPLANRKYSIEEKNGKIIVSIDRLEEYEVVVVEPKA